MSYCPNGLTSLRPGQIIDVNGFTDLMQYADGTFYVPRREGARQSKPYVPFIKIADPYWWTTPLFYIGTGLIGVLLYMLAAKLCGK